MDNFYKLKKIIIFFIIILYAVTAKAETTPALSHTDYSGFLSASAFCIANGLNPPDFYADEAIGQCKRTSDDGVQYSATMTTQYSCPAGGTLSGAFCINVPACVSPEIRSTITQQCYLPLICGPGEVFIESQMLCMPRECPIGQYFDGGTEQCEIEPFCANNEVLNTNTGECVLRELYCPGHTHHSIANDRCIPDPPLQCPIGMHDDGTYLCVANNAVHCRDNQTHGYINGQPQCINKTETSDSKKKANDYEAERNAAESALDDAKNNAAAAKAALDDDPTNQTKIDANNESQAALSQATNNLADAIAKLKNQYEESDHKNLAAAEEHLKDMNEREIKAERDGFGVVPVAQALPSHNTDISSISIPSTSAMSCPPPYVMQLHGTGITMSYQPYCDFAASVKPLILTMAYLAGALIILGSFKD